MKLYSHGHVKEFLLDGVKVGYELEEEISAICLIIILCRYWSINRIIYLKLISKIVIKFNHFLEFLAFNLKVELSIFVDVGVDS